ncbi:MAG: hypothetical protein WCK39_11015, partial [Methanomassiliicoccales archaeon]
WVWSKRSIGGEPILACHQGQAAYPETAKDTSYYFRIIVSLAKASDYRENRDISISGWSSVRVRLSGL